MPETTFPRGDRPQDDAVVTIGESVAWQRDVVERAGSPTAALILEAVEEDLAASGRLTGLLPTHVRFGSLPGLRLMAAVHLLALQRRAPRVALHLPTLGGVPPADARTREQFRTAVVDALTTHPAELEAALARTPQTNETGRAALLRCALVREDLALPVRLREIGSSAGLNLRVEHLPGLPGLEEGPLPTIADRLGCDLDPVDVTTDAGRALLTSYVWVDDVDRYARLRAALDVARRYPAEVVRRDAADFCESLELVAGTTTVLWHSAMWVYLPGATHERIRAALARLGESAGPDRPLVHASWEWTAASDGDATFALVVRRWTGGPDDGRPRLIATGTSHGRGVTRVEGEPWLDLDPLER
jgi:hypothetical protein